jgi:hypothetical protein
VSGRARVVALVAAALVVVGCSSTSNAKVSTSASSGGVSATELRDYVTQIEKVRLPVNSLLDGADPILDAYRAKTITPDAAADQMDALEQRFAGYTLGANTLAPTNPVLAKVHAPYAQTYYLEDSYLATLASDLREGNFDNLPNTQDAQRLTIIEWRTQLEILAAKTGVRLPADIQQAGRGEIAPSVNES